MGQIGLQSVVVRSAELGDHSGLAEVMFDAVRNGKSAYNQEQRRAWVPEVRTGEVWRERLERQSVVVAEREGELLGFMSLDCGGYIDLAFIRPAAQGRGLFRRLLQEIDRRARRAGESRLWVHASLTAEPAFSAMGFSILEKQVVALRGLELERFEMQKVLVRHDGLSGRTRETR